MGGVRKASKRKNHVIQEHPEGWENSQPLGDLEKRTAGRENSKGKSPKVGATGGSHVLWKSHASENL